jgi:hypothetical protein
MNDYATVKFSLNFRQAAKMGAGNHLRLESYPAAVDFVEMDSRYYSHKSLSVRGYTLHNSTSTATEKESLVVANRLHILTL